MENVDLLLDLPARIIQLLVQRAIIEPLVSGVVILELERILIEERKVEPWNKQAKFTRHFGLDLIAILDVDIVFGIAKRATTWAHAERLVGGKI